MLVLKRKKSEQVCLKYSFIDGYAKRTGDIAPYLRDYLSEKTYAQLQRLRALGYNKAVPYSYVWPRPDGFEIVLIGDEAAIEWEKFLDDLQEEVKKNDPMLLKCDKTEHSLRVTDQIFLGKAVSLVVTKSDREKRYFAEDPEKHIRHVITKQLKRVAFALDLIDKNEFIACKIDRYVRLPDFYPVPFVNEKQSVVHVEFMMSKSFLGIWQIGYFSRFGYGRIFKKTHDRTAQSGGRDTEEENRVLLHGKENRLPV